MSRLPGEAEEVHLPLQILPPAVTDAVQHPLVDGDELGPAGAQTVEGPGTDQILHRPLVHVRPAEALAEVLKAEEGPVLLPLPHHRLDEAAADVLNGHQPEADALLLHGEAVRGAVHIRGQQSDVPLLALGDVLAHPVGVVQHTGQQGRHVLPGVVDLEPSGLIGHDGVAHRVGFVEGVVGEVIDLTIDGLCHALWDAVGHAAGDPPVRIPVEEGRMFPLQILGLLLAHGPAHHVRLPQGVPRQLLENLHHLLLIDDAAVGDG